MGRRLTKEEFISRESDLLSGEYEFIGNYVNAHTKTLFKHNKCGYEWEITPSDFHAGKRCPKCATIIRSKELRLTKEEFVEREEDIKSGKYSMLGEYKNSYTKTLFRHSACDHEWKTTPSHFQQGHRCPRCTYQKMGSLKRLTKEEFINREPDLLNGRYSMLGEYITTDTKTLFRHNKCGYEWEIKPSAFHSGNRCPRCNQPKGERVISKLLEDLDVVFKSQKIFNTCRHKRPLPFDFYVNNSFLIEYDGEQHFESIDHFGGDEGFEIRQLRDNIKTKWAKDNGIPLVRIPYTEFDNIEQIIKESIEKYSIQKAG